MEGLFITKEKLAGLENFINDVLPTKYGNTLINFLGGCKEDTLAISKAQEEQAATKEETPT